MCNQTHSPINHRDTDPAVIVSALRTPFLKHSTGFQHATTLQLACSVVNELIDRTGVPPQTYTGCVFGQAIPSLDYINLAREVVLRTRLDNQTTVAHSVSQACITSMQALTSAINAIVCHEHDAMIVGGADNIDDTPVAANPKLTNALTLLQTTNNPLEKARILSSLSPKVIVPVAPGFAVEPTTGLSMGQHCELMAKDWGITRTQQDDLAHRSHVRASNAWKRGFFDDQVMPIAPPDYSAAFARDNLVRNDSNLLDYAALPPAFDSERGTITAGNSSPLSAGAAALCVMRQSKAISLGLKPLGRLRSWCYRAVDPSHHLLMAPVFAIPVALKQAGLSLSDIDIFEIHEAFAAQVACTLKAMNSFQFCSTHLGLDMPLGQVDPANINPNGGSIALGHPFAATAVRVVMQALSELHRTNKQFALIALCAGGGLGAAAVLEVAS